MQNKGLNLAGSAGPARLAATVTVLIAVTCLIGWAFNIRTFTSVLPGAVQMKANTGLCILLCGAALLMLADDAGRRIEVAARAIAMLAAAIGLASLAEYLLGWQLGIDELLVKDELGAYSIFHGRMSPFSGAAFVALGTGITGLRLRYLDRPARLFGGIGLAIGMVSLIGYLWNAGELITDRWLPPVAINTAVCFIAIGVGILTTSKKLQPNRVALSAQLAGVEVRVLAGFILAISLLVLGGSFTYRSSVEFTDSVEWVVHTQEVRTALSDVFGLLAGSNVVARDFLATRDDARFAEYNRLIAATRASLARLRGLVSDTGPQRENVLVLMRLADQGIDSLEGSMRALQVFGIPAARAVLTVSRSENNFRKLRDQTELMDGIEAQQLTQREAYAARGRFATLISLLLTLAAATGLFIALFRSIHREMRARRNTEQALRDSDQYNRSIIESSPDCVAILNSDAEVTQINPHGARLMDIGGLPTMLGKSWCSFWQPLTRPAADAAVAKARSGEEARFSGMTLASKGEEKWWDIIVMPIRSAAGEPDRLLATARDVTDDKRTATSLVAANHFLDSLFENLPVMLALKDARTLKFVRFNRLFAEVIGYSKEQLIGRTAHELFGQDEADYVVASDREALAKGCLLEIPKQTITSASLGARTFHTMKLPIGEDPAKPQFLLEISQDISQRMLGEQAIRELNAALQGKAAQLQSSNKELESFSYSVSHDLRAPLRAIDGFAEILEEDYKEKFDSEGRRYLAVIRSNSRRMGELIDDLLSFSRLGRQAITTVEINMDVLVGEVVDEIMNTQPSPGEQPPATRIEIKPLPPAQGDRALLRQVWTNLISNAVKYSGRSRQPCVQVSGRQSAGESEYSVTDNGVGFNMEYVQKLFGVFQRLHRNDEFPGTGVGLAIVHRVVTRHGGRVWAEGSVNQGAVFSFALPRGNSDG